MSWRTGTVVGVVVLTSGTAAFASTHEIHPGQMVPTQGATAAPPASIPLDVETSAQLSPLVIERIRLDAPASAERENSVVLKFQMSNVSSSTLADIVFEVSLLEKPQHEQLDAPRRILGGPFAIRGQMVLDPGYTADCEILLRNISPTCRCAANVRVLSFRPIGDSDR